MQVTTDNKWKPFVYRSDVPKRVLERDFDYQNADEAFDGFFKYRGVWYHLDMFMRTEGVDDFKNWNGYHSNSAFSGVLLKVSRDGESYKVATYIA